MEQQDHGEWASPPIPGFCHAATIAEIAKHGHVLTPGRYVGAEDAGATMAKPFAEKYPRLVAELEECFAEGRAFVGTMSSLI